MQIIDKVRFKHLGNRGHTTFFYDVQCGRYLPCDEKPEIDAAKEGELGSMPFNIRYSNIRWINAEGDDILLDEEERISGKKSTDSPTLF